MSDGQQRPTRGRRDPLESLSYFIASSCRYAGIRRPLVVLERLAPKVWETFVDEYEDTIGVGRGSSAEHALGLLLDKVKAVFASALPYTEASPANAQSTLDARGKMTQRRDA